MTTTQVTLLVPAYNYGRFITQALDSLLSQTLRDMELIVIDDASTDETPRIVAQYASDARVRVVRHEQNQGHIASYNEGLAMARGNYIGIVSADDYCLRPDALERQVAVFAENPRVGMVYSAHLMLDPDGHMTTVAHGAADAVRSGFDEFRSLLWGNYILHSGVLLKREVQSALGPYDPELPQSGDWDLWLRASAGYDVGYIAEPLYVYRLHRSNMQSRGISPAQQAQQNARTLAKGFAALPPDAPADLWHVRAGAVQHALLQTAWFDLRNGRARRGWQGLTYALRQSPGLLRNPECWRFATRLGALSLLGQAGYSRLHSALAGIKTRSAVA